MSSFKGGVHPPQNKATSSFPIERFPAPAKVFIHLFQSAGAASEPVIVKGQRVLKGEVIAAPCGKISACIHSPVSGIVEGIEKWPHYSGDKLDAIIIANDFKEEEKRHRELKSVKTLAPSQIVEIIRRAGIVGLGGAAFPTDVKLSVPFGKKINTLIVNGCECEPYLTADEKIIEEKADEIFEGAKIAARAVSAKDIIIAVEDNKLSKASELLRRQDMRMSVRVLPAKYPQGGEKQLIYALLRRKVPACGLPSDVGCVVINVQTAVAVNEAVYSGRPLFERVVTLGGFFRKPGNVIIPIGTRLEDIINLRGGIPDNVNKIVFGGPMMGQPVSNFDVTVSKATSGILLLESTSPSEFECIRCLRCAAVCPMNLIPRQSYLLYKKGIPCERAKDCIECGACAYVCPAGIPLIHYLKWSKNQMLNTREEGKK
ncbi:MAG: electron transport complex subunit RsxC [bacterium]